MSSGIEILDTIRLQLQLDTRAKVLIVGGRGANFPERFRRDSRLVFWDSTDPATHKRDKIPADVKVVIVTRFISHSLFARLKSMIPPGVKLLKYAQGTGRIKDLLESVEIGKEEKRMIDPGAREAGVDSSVLEPAGGGRRPLTKAKRGTLSRFVRENADFSAEDALAEIDRLFGKAKAQGLETTQRSLGNAFYHLRKRLKGQKRAVPALAGEMPETPPGSIPAELAAVPPKISEDSLRVLRDFVGQLQIAAIALEELLAEHDRLKRIEQEVQRLRSVMAPLLAALNGNPATPKEG